MLWTLPQQIKGPTQWLEGGIPDTFTYHLHVSSTGPMSVSILTFDNYAKAVGCMNAGVGSAYYCMNYSGAVIAWINKSQIDYDFHLAEGCAGYLAVFTSTSNITVKPNISVTYNPASKLTGVPPATLLIGPLVHRQVCTGEAAVMPVSLSGAVRAELALLSTRIV